MRKTTLLALFFLSFLYFSTDHNRFSSGTSQGIAKAGLISIPASGKKKNDVRYLTRANFEDHISSLYQELELRAYALDFDVFRLGMVGYYSLEREGALNKKGLLTIIDFARPSTEKRFYTIDLLNRQVKFHTYVAHGRNTGQNMAESFSNIPHSNQSSLGFVVTGETYVGSKGYSLRIDGKEEHFNDKVRSRAVVIHAADYVSESWINRYGRLGRSQGCPALPPDLSRKVIDAIKDKTAIFTYYPEPDYLNSSRYLRVEDLLDTLDETPIPLAAAKAPLRHS